MIRRPTGAPVTGRKRTKRPALPRWERKCITCQLCGAVLRDEFAAHITEAHGVNGTLERTFNLHVHYNRRCHYYEDLVWIGNDLVGLQQRQVREARKRPRR
jgi:hypothetical protein